MAGPIIQASLSGALKPRIIAEFNRSYDQRFRARSPIVGKSFLEVKSTLREETHGGFQSVPIPTRWVRGEPRSRTALSEFYTTVTNYSYGVWIGWHEEDEEDDQTEKLVARTQDSAVRFSQLDERIMIQLITAATDPKLLPSIPNAYDGSALFLGTTRFGVSTGNIFTGAGVATPTAIRNDFLAAIGSNFAQFQDTESQPYWTPEDLDYGNFAIIFNAAHIQVFNDAFLSTMLPANPLGSAPFDNSWLNKRAPMLFPTQRITGDDWYILLIGSAGPKPFVKQVRRDVRQMLQDVNNSDEARDTKEKGVGFDGRFGYSIWEPRCAVKVDN